MSDGPANCLGDEAGLDVEPRADRRTDPEARQGHRTEPPIAAARLHSSHRSSERHLCGGTSWTKTIPSGSSSGDRIGSRGIRGPGPDGRGRNGDAGSFRTHQRRAIDPNESTAYDNRTPSVKGLDPSSFVTPSGERTLPPALRRRLESRDLGSIRNRRSTIVSYPTRQGDRRPWDPTRMARHRLASVRSMLTEDS